MTGLDARWRARLERALDRPPEAPRTPLWLAPMHRPAALVGSIEAGLAQALACAGFPLRLDGAWHLEPEPAIDIDVALAGIAQWMRDHGFAGAWRDELLAVTDAAGAALGRMERAAVRPLGIATRAVHLVVCDQRGHAWVQQRAFDKATDPGRWDTTMGGLVAAGETTPQTLARETWEEAGLRLADLRGVAPLGRITVRRPVAEGYMVEHIEMFEATLPGASMPVNQDGEVECFECLGPAALVARLQADAFTVEAAMILVTWLERRAAAER